MEKEKSPASASLYDSNDYYSNDTQSSRLSPFFNGLLSLLDRQKASSIQKTAKLKKGATVFDVGAGDGKFLYFMRQAGCQVYGTTASQLSQAAAQRIYNINIDFTTRIDASVPEESVDLLTYWHVFEHLEKPEEHSRHWPKLLSPEGMIMIEVPNIDSLGAHLCYKAWLGSDEAHHINHQRPAEIRALLRSLGFRVVQETTFSLKFSYIFLWSALLGFLFGENYHFDQLMNRLKNPLQNLRRHTLATGNSYLALIYLAPFVVLLLIIETFLQRGEVYRVYGQR